MIFTHTFQQHMPYAWAWFLSQVASILLFAVCLLVMVAFILLYDRKIFAAVQMRRGPNVVGIFRPAAELRRSWQVPDQGSDHPGRRQQGDLHPGAAGQRRDRLRGLGGGADGRRLG